MPRPEQWISRTALVFGKRPADLKEIDRLYARYHEYSNRKNADRLRVALKAYLVANGRFWAKVERNVKSGGLMEQVYRMVEWTDTSPADTPETRIKRAVMADGDNARLGVLYLFSRLDVATQFLSVALEGGFTLGGAATPALTGGVGDLSKLAKERVDGGVETGVSLANAGVGFARSSHTATTRAQHVVAPRPVAVPGDMDVGLIDSKDWGLGFRALEVGAEILQKIKQAISDAVDWIIAKIQQNESAVWTLAGTIKNAIINGVVSHVAKSAAPFVSGGLDILKGVTSAVAAAKQRIEVFLVRSRFQIQPGHPELLANAIQKEMDWAIGKGVWDAVKGAGKVTLDVFSGGLTAIATAVMAGIEFAVKTIMRFREASKLQTFINEAKTHYAAAAMPVMEEDIGPEDWDNIPTRGRSDSISVPRKSARTPVAPRPGSIVTDIGRFTAFYETGCSASPCVPMLTLNSGICGDLMQLMRLFDDTGSVLDRASAQASFDAAAEYFTTLKAFGRSYITKAGLHFTSTDAAVKGILGHAVGSHPDGEMSKWDAALAFVGG